MHHIISYGNFIHVGPFIHKAIKNASQDIKGKINKIKHQDEGMV